MTALKMEKTGDGRYDVESVNFAGETYFVVQDEKSKKWTVTLSDGQELGEGLTFKEAKALLTEREEEGSVETGTTNTVGEESSASTVKDNWIVILEDGQQFTFKSGGTKQAKYRAYRIGKDKGSKVAELHLAVQNVTEEETKEVQSEEEESTDEA